MSICSWRVRGRPLEQAAAGTGYAGVEMTTRTLAAIRGGVAALTASFLAAVVGLGLSALPAAAHASLLSSTPEEGATLEEAPAEVVLEFDDDLHAEFTQVAVLDQNDGHHEQGDPEIDGGRVTQAVGQLEPGDYRVSYRVGSADGHPVSGVITFTVTGEPEMDEQQPEPEVGAQTDAPTEPATEQAASTPATDAAAESNSAAPLWVAGAAALVVAGGVLAFLIARRSRAGSDPTHNHGP